MKRLTFEGNFCDIAQCREFPCPYDGMCSQRKVWERLKEDEDAGLSPEMVAHLKIVSMGRTIAQITEFEGVPIDRLRELAEADKQGRVVVLPPGIDHFRSIQRAICDGCNFQFPDSTCKTCNSSECDIIASVRSAYFGGQNE